MARTHFIPARDSRHRAAVLALYRALAKTAEKVPLQGHIGDASAHSSPIRAILRRRFEKNSSDTSPRLVFAALTAGYKVRATQYQGFGLLFMLLTEQYSFFHFFTSLKIRARPNIDISCDTSPSGKRSHHGKPARLRLNRPNEKSPS
jgi:hypothetical protein